MYESIQFLLRNLTKVEKLYLARLLNREFKLSINCAGGFCNILKKEECGIDNCACKCHLDVGQK